MPHLTPVKVVPSRLALLDLIRLRQFLQAKNPLTATRAANVIRAALKQIGHNPEGFAAVPDMPYHRDAVIPFGASGYVARYLYKPGGEVTVLRIRHQLEDGAEAETESSATGDD
jgi:plasmid stabilization system protein ParE